MNHSNRLPSDRAHDANAAATADGNDAVDNRIQRGTPAYRRTNLALFLGGYATFALLYCVQPLMPLFSRVFRVSPATSSLTMSWTTALLAIMLLAASTLSESWGRRGLMIGSTLSAAVLTVLCGLVTDFHQLLLTRALEGVALSGLPAVAMAYLSEEIHPAGLGMAMGLYIGGSALGGMSGRLLVGALTDLTSWRLALIIMGLMSLTAGVVFWRSLPLSRNFTSRPLSVRHQLGGFQAHLRDPALLGLFGCGFLLLGSLATLYNYIGYRLMAPPYRLSQTAVGAVFAIYLLGIGSSISAGRLADHFGRRAILLPALLVMLTGVLMSAAQPLWLIITGVAIATIGFFAGHSTASSWVGRRARTARAQASALYLLFYYTGSSVLGYLGGLVLANYGWNGIVILLSALLIGGCVIAERLRRVPPHHG